MRRFSSGLGTTTLFCYKIHIHLNESHIKNLKVWFLLFGKFMRLTVNTSYWFNC